jgi:hypothetical protein
MFSLVSMFVRLMIYAMILMVWLAVAVIIGLAMLVATIAGQGHAARGWGRSLRWRRVI